MIRLLTDCRGRNLGLFATFRARRHPKVPRYPPVAGQGHCAVTSHFWSRGPPVKSEPFAAASTAAERIFGRRWISSAVVQ